MCVRVKEREQGRGKVWDRGKGSGPSPALLALPCRFRSGPFPFLVWSVSVSVIGSGSGSFPFRPWSGLIRSGSVSLLYIQGFVYPFRVPFPVRSAPGQALSQPVPTWTRKGPRGQGRSVSGHGQGRGGKGAAPSVCKVVVLFGPFSFPLRYVTCPVPSDTPSCPFGPAPSLFRSVEGHGVEMGRKGKLFPKGGEGLKRGKRAFLMV